MGTLGSTTRRACLLATLALAALTAMLFAGCGISTHGADIVAGKQAFVAKCGACHVLSRAGTKGTTGPDLDAAFQQDLKDGFKRSTVMGVVEHQILYPNRNGVMPAKLYTNSKTDCSAADKKKYGGECATAQDVAAYVSSVVAKPGKDQGLLATAVGSAQKALAKATKGTLSIPADPNGRLLFQYKNAVAPAGKLTFKSLNTSSTLHDIAVEGPGVPLTKGAVGKGGHVSQFNVTLRPGKYTFLCTVPGHAQAGMKGTLTVK